MIEIIPSIDISNGKAVKRIRGIKGTGLILGDPVKVANKIYDEGYRKIHIVDLDAAEGAEDNENYIKEICKIGFKWIQVGGGIRNYEKANRILSYGSSALIFSTLPFTNPNLFKDMVNKIGKDKILISIDYDNKGNVLIKGWREKALKVTEAIKKVNELDLLGTILTYIPNEGTSNGIDYNVREFSNMIKGIKEYAGGVASYDDVKYLESIGFNYVIVGMSFYLNRIRGVRFD